MMFDRKKVRFIYFQFTELKGQNFQKKKILKRSNIFTVNNFYVTIMVTMFSFQHCVTKTKNLFHLHSFLTRRKEGKEGAKNKKNVVFCSYAQKSGKRTLKR